MERIWIVHVERVITMVNAYMKVYGAARSVM